MGRNPVQNNTDACLMKRINKKAKIIRSAVTAGRCKKAAALISPGTVIRVLTDADQFNMRVAQVSDICCELTCKFPIIQKSLRIRIGIPFPGTEMHFIHCKRRVMNIHRTP